MKGSSDISAIEYAFENHWQVYFDNHLHAKLYCFDNERAIIGSANLTNNALNKSKGNLELVTKLSLLKEDCKKLNNILLNSHYLTKENLKEIKKLKVAIIPPLSKAIQEWTFLTRKIIEYLFLEDLIGCSNFSKLKSKTKGILDIKKQDTKPNIQKKFINSN